MMGFTRKEQRFFLILIAAFCIGLGLNLFQDQQSVAAARKWRAERDAVWARFQTQSREPVSLENGFADKDAFIGKININRADSQELQQLPRIGPVLAERIIAYRTRSGSFKKCDEIQNVRGIGIKTFERIKVYITVDD